MRKILLDLALLRELVEIQRWQQWRVAEYFGVSRDTVNRVCCRLGLATQRTGPRSGEEHTGWKGGVRIVKGYRMLYRPEHPNATKQGYVAEHRLVMEQSLARYLKRREVVHHVNDDRLDNRPENLGLFATNAEHLRKTLAGQLPHWSPEGKERMAQGLRKRTSQLLSGVGVPQRNQTTGRWITTPGKSSPRAS